MNLFRVAAGKSTFSLPLQSMRGIAALVVVACHIMERIYDHGRNPFNGSAAVTFFFVLSGLVLGLSLARQELTAARYGRYLARRVFRIMPLMIVTATLGMAYLLTVEPHAHFPLLPPGGYGHFTKAQAVSAYVGYSKKFDPPAWSIFVELLVSALLPFMVLTGRSRALAVLAGLLLLAFAAHDFGLQHAWNFYLVDFFAGITILWWGEALTRRLEKLPVAAFWAVMLGLLVAFYALRLIWIAPFGDPRFNLAELALITPFIAVAFFCERRFVWLEKSFFRLLGDVSYSLYLTHWFVIVLAFNLLAAVLPGAFDHLVLTGVGMFLVLPPICFGIACLSYRVIERPGIAAGQKLIPAPRLIS